MSYEKLTIVGNLGQDPELRYLQDARLIHSRDDEIGKDKMAHREGHD